MFGTVIDWTRDAWSVYVGKEYPDEHPVIVALISIATLLLALSVVGIALGAYLSLLLYALLFFTLAYVGMRAVIWLYERLLGGRL